MCQILYYSKFAAGAFVRRLPLTPFFLLLTALLDVESLEAHDTDKLLTVIDLRCRFLVCDSVVTPVPSLADAPTGVANDTEVLPTALFQVPNFVTVFELAVKVIASMEWFIKL